MTHDFIEKEQTSLTLDEPGEIFQLPITVSKEILKEPGNQDNAIKTTGSLAWANYNGWSPGKNFKLKIIIL